MSALFEVNRKGKEQDKVLAQKSKTKTRANTSVLRGNGTLIDRINQIKAMVAKYLGGYEEETQLITTYEDLLDYLKEAVNQGVISIDTETTGLDPMLDKIVGLCIYTPTRKTAYVPINHISYITQVRAENQLTAEEVAKALNKTIISNRIEVIMFNATFDIRVIRNQLGVKDIYCTWDTSLASKILNENEPQANLKDLHNKYCLNGKGDAFRFDDLFRGISFDLMPITTG